MTASSAKHDRGLSVEDLAALPLDARRRLVQGIAVENGLTFLGGTPRGTAFDLRFAQSLFGEPRAVLIRIPEDGSSAEALAELEEQAVRAGASDHLLIGHPDDPEQLLASPHYLPASRLLKLIEGSAMLQWGTGAPALDATAYQGLRQNHQDDLELDPTGIRWLHPLSLNKIPAELTGSTRPAETWFEEATYRVLTRLFRLTGRRLGAARSGIAEPDALLTKADYDFSVVVDTKAARDGWTMDSAELRKLLEYAGKPWCIHGRTLPVRTAIVVSSSFPAGKSVYEKRRQRFQAQGSDLMYLPAPALAEGARELAKSVDAVRAADMIDWTSLADIGWIEVHQFVDEVKRRLTQARLSANSDEGADGNK